MPNNDSDRIGVFIDGVSLQHAADALQMRIDFKRLLLMYRQQGHLVRANYYGIAAPPPAPDTLRPLLDWLSYNGFSVVCRPSRYTDDVANALALAIDISVDAMQLSAHLDHVVLFSACGRLTHLVRTLKSMGRRVTVVSTLQGQCVDDDLRREADIFLDLNELRPILGAEMKRSRVEQELR